MSFLTLATQCSSDQQRLGNRQQAKAVPRDRGAYSKLLDNPRVVIYVEMIGGCY